MSNESSPVRQVSFKVDQRLAELLEKLPNKSAFIRRAILAMQEVPCPLCNGDGVFPNELPTYVIEFLEEAARRFGA